MAPLLALWLPLHSAAATLFSSYDCLVRSSVVASCVCGISRLRLRSIAASIICDHVYLCFRMFAASASYSYDSVRLYLTAATFNRGGYEQQ